MSKLTIKELIEPHVMTDEMEHLYKELDISGKAMLRSALLSQGTFSMIRERYRNMCDLFTTKVEDTYISVPLHTGMVMVPDEETGEWAEKYYRSPYCVYQTRKVRLEDGNWDLVPRGCTQPDCTQCHDEAITFRAPKLVERLIQKTGMKQDAAYREMIRLACQTIPDSVYIRQLAAFWHGDKRKIKMIGRMWRVIKFFDCMPWNARMSRSRVDMANGVVDKARRRANKEADNITNPFDLEKYIKKVYKMEEERTVDEGDAYDGHDVSELERGEGDEYLASVFGDTWTRFQKVRDGEEADDIDRIEVRANNLALPKKDNRYVYAAILQKDCTVDYASKVAQYGYVPYTGIDIRPNQARLNKEGKWRTFYQPAVVGDLKALHHLVYRTIHESVPLKDTELTEKMKEANQSVLWVSKRSTISIDQEDVRVVLDPERPHVPNGTLVVPEIRVDPPFGPPAPLVVTHFRRVYKRQRWVKTTKSIRARFVIQRPCFYKGETMSYNTSGDADLWVAIFTEDIAEHFNVQMKSPYVFFRVGMLRKGSVRGSVLKNILLKSERAKRPEIKS